MFAGRGCSGGFIVSSVYQRGEAAAVVSSLRALPTCCEHLEGWTLADSESAAGGSSFPPFTTEERLQRCFLVSSVYEKGKVAAGDSSSPGRSNGETVAFGQWDFGGKLR